MLFLGLYHYNALVESIDNRFVRQDWNTDERNRQSFDIFYELGHSAMETVETYYAYGRAEARRAWYMIGHCYKMEVVVRYDAEQSYMWYKKAANKGIPVACWRVTSI